MIGRRVQIFFARAADIVKTRAIPPKYPFVSHSFWYDPCHNAYKDGEEV